MHGKADNMDTGREVNILNNNALHEIFSWRLIKIANTTIAQKASVVYVIFYV